MKRDLLATALLPGEPSICYESVPAPATLKHQLPLSWPAAATVSTTRRAIQAVLDGRDRRLLVIVGPCSLHDPAAGLDYARRLRGLAQELSDRLLVVMRAYFEKPRTGLGWKGYLNDPELDGSCRIAEGLAGSRRFLLALNELGLPAAVEVLDPLAPLYLGDLVSWAAIGARTTESQTHREVSSGLAMPVGFKNGTDGRVDAAIHAILTAARPHGFLHLAPTGHVAIARSQGNPYGHLVLRGGGGRPNYDAASVATAAQALRRAGLPARIVVDCAHGNSDKQPERQALVLADVVRQIRCGSTALVGVMIESFLAGGRQTLPEVSASAAVPVLAQLQYGCSVTDPCVDWTTTEQMLRNAYRDLLGCR